MSRFNTMEKTENLAGGAAYSQSRNLELISILLTSFMKDQFYRSADDTIQRLRELLKDYEFAAKLAIYARTKFGMRSVTHVLASELAPYISGQPWAASFYERIVYRPDDMTEIISYHFARKQKLSNAMKKGFAAAFARFDAYQLAKYRSEGRKVSLVDVVNLVRPKQPQEYLKALMTGTLKSSDTWESELTRAGQAGTDKGAVWERLLSEGRLGYFALLRNLRNIMAQSPATLPKALEMLTDRKRIKKSLVFPFRFLTAIKEIEKLPGARDVVMALNKAIELSLDNVPVFEGKTLVALDVSGSMTWEKNGMPAEIGAVFACALYKTNDADLMTFDGDARYVTLNPTDSLLTLVKQIDFPGGGTNFHSIFELAGQKYDRIIILSDMQGWMGYNPPLRAFDVYKHRTGAEPLIYSFDLAGYGTLQFPEKNVFTLAGFSDKVFDLMGTLEKGSDALKSEINRIEW